LWRQYRRGMATSGRLCRSYPQGHKARGPASRAVDQVRAGDQRSDRPHSRCRGASRSARPRRRGDRMKRREFITLIAGATAAPSLLWPLMARGQQAERVPRIGVLMGFAADREGRTRLRGFLQALQQFGWTDGRNVRIDIRWAGPNADDIRK